MNKYKAGNQFKFQFTFGDKLSSRQVVFQHKFLPASLLDKRIYCRSHILRTLEPLLLYFISLQVKVKVSSSTLRVNFKVLVCLLAYTLPLINRPNGLYLRSSFLTYLTSLGLSGGCVHNIKKLKQKANCYTLRVPALAEEDYTGRLLRFLFHDLRLSRFHSCLGRFHISA